MKRWSIALLLLAVAGCGNTTETGYTPRPLSGDAKAMHSVYAPTYSKEAAQGQTEGQHSLEERRPGGY